MKVTCYVAVLLYFQICHMFRCARIQGLETAEGLLLFGREHFHVIDGLTLLATKEIKDIDNVPAE